MHRLLEKELTWPFVEQVSLDGFDDILNQNLKFTGFLVFPNDINCYTTCFYNAEGILYDPITGVHVKAFKRRLGSAAYPENDWKTANADLIIDECVAELPENRGVIGCNPNLRTLTNCYWNKLFQLCPAEIKNATNCLY